MGKQDASEDGESRAAEGKSSKRRKHLKRTPEVHQCHIDIIRGVKDEDVEAGMGAIRRMVSHGVIPDKDSCTAVLSILVTSPVRWDYVSEVCRPSSTINPRGRIDRLVLIVSGMDADGKLKDSFPPLQQRA
jgi:hypothetical protein